VNENDARLRHPWLRTNRVLRVMLQTRWSAEAWSQVKAEFTKALALALLLWGVAEPVNAWDEPSGFRDIPWGSPPAVAKEKLPDLSCAGRCSGYLTIGQVRVFTMIEFETGGGMDAVSLSFPSSNFYEIKVAFVERYGEPTARRRWSWTASWRCSTTSSGPGSSGFATRTSRWSPHRRSSSRSTCCT